MIAKLVFRIIGFKRNDELIIKKKRIVYILSIRKKDLSASDFQAY